MKYPKLNEKQIKELKDIINDNNSSNQEIKKAQIILTEKLLIFWDGAGWHRGSEV